MRILAAVLLLGAVLSPLVLSEAPYNLKDAFKRVSTMLNATYDESPNYLELRPIINLTLPCLSALSSFEVDSTADLPQSVRRYLETVSATSLALEVLAGMDAVDLRCPPVRSVSDPAFWVDMEAFMATDTFTAIHNFLWGNDEFLDLVKYMHDSGYDGSDGEDDIDIYTFIKGIYTQMGRDDLMGNIAPPTSKGGARKSSSKAPRPRSRFPVHLVRSPIIEAQTCEPIKLLQTIFNSKFHVLFKGIVFAAQELIGNPGVHGFLVKIGEWQKGEMVHELLELPELEGEGFSLIRRFVVKNALVQHLNKIVCELAALNLGNDRMFRYIVNLIQWLVWNYPFPA